MYIIEGVRRSGKTHTLEIIDKFFIGYHFYKDLGMRLIKDSPIDTDDFSIGRDYALAQFILKIDSSSFENLLIIDRQYFSSYVYGQFYRHKYDKQFWKDHILKVEKIYGDFINNIKVIFIELTEEDFKFMAEMGRQKDWLEDSDINSYKAQYELYLEALEISKARIFKMKAFQGEGYINYFFNKVRED
jgi:thymidylate kinase